MKQKFNVGALPLLEGNFQDLEGGQQLDPTSVAFFMKEPDGTATSYVFGTDPELVRDSVGKFHVAWPITQSGVHHYRYESTGIGQAAKQAQFTAEASKAN